MIKRVLVSLAKRVKGDRDVEGVQKSVTSNTKGSKIRTRGQLSEYRLLNITDPLVAGIVEYKISHVLNGGVYAIIRDSDGNAVDDHPLKEVIDRIPMYSIIRMVLNDMIVYGNAYLELVENGRGNVVDFVTVKPSTMNIVLGDDGKPTEFIQTISGAEISFEPNRLVHFKNRCATDEKFGFSDIENVAEYVDIIRDMSFDLANFIATKAHPPIVWKLGTPERPWGKKDIEAWGNDRASPSPADQISVRGDVDAQVVGVSGETIDVEPYISMFAALVLTGMRAPSSFTPTQREVGQFTIDSQINSFKASVMDMRTYISEVFEKQVFRYMLESHGVDGMTIELHWKDFDIEDERRHVNNIVQLVQNGIISPRDGALILKEKGVIDVDIDVESAEMAPVQDKPESATPELQDEAGEPAKESDGRSGSKRKEFISK